ncbi:MAG: motility protein A [Alkaliphilus sp.]|nr:motility protein A [Alkaliphilus transvaalensis]PHS35251.1 MAG: motility protein A [Alkaliphilus sp.]
MDIGSIAGLLVGLLFIILGIMDGGSLASFINMPSLQIVVGGTFAATFIAYPMKKVFESAKIAGKVFGSSKDDPTIVLSKIIELANTARKEGLLALEEISQSIDDKFLNKGVMLIVDGTDPELVRNLLETELAFIEERHSDGRGLFDTLGMLAPAFGMVGTLIGLINMLAKLDDPSTVGPSMAVALITTLYGSLMANLIFIPIATKLKLRSREEILIKEIIVEGLLSIQAGENPRIIEEKLKAFLPPKIREALQAKQEEVVEGA